MRYRISAYNNIGVALARKGNMKEAIRHFSRALELTKRRMNMPLSTAGP